MSEAFIDPAPFLETRGEDPHGPLIRMVVSLGFPGMGPGAARIQEETTRLAFDAVRAAGGRPRLVAYTTGEGLTPEAEVFHGADAIVFLGGADVDPACYGYTGAPPANLYGVDRRADDYCISLFQSAASRDVPTLAICRGSQLMNVAFGGTLIPDIEDWKLHKGDGNPLFIDEEVLLEPDSEIARILGRTRVVVRNGHHQAVDRVGDQLRATARAHDGIVEGTQHRTASWMIGVQWHPEEPGADLRDQALIFEALVERARR
ncbi:MAG: gamma-glutamyl-gamma-aminobutyrate hydrolase family protein [Leucobacter sp.]|nr:gamma-glutamyl-gamma-aminobutyrate hydrolase family protein [Leucobacter sp.]